MTVIIISILWRMLIQFLHFCVFAAKAIEKKAKKIDAIKTNDIFSKFKKCILLTVYVSASEDAGRHRDTETR